MAGGRPTVMTEDVVQKLEEAFLLGCTDSEACLYADISRSTLHNYCSANEEFLDRKEILKQNPVLKARKVVIDALNDANLSAAHKVIERKDGTKINHAGYDGKAIAFVFEGIVSDGTRKDSACK